MGNFLNMFQGNFLNTFRGNFSFHRKQQAIVSFSHILVMARYHSNQPQQVPKPFQTTDDTCFLLPRSILGVTQPVKRPELGSFWATNPQPEETNPNLLPLFDYSFENGCVRDGDGTPFGTPVLALAQDDPILLEEEKFVVDCLLDVPPEHPEPDPKRARRVEIPSTLGTKEEQTRFEIANREQVVQDLLALGPEEYKSVPVEPDYSKLHQDMEKILANSVIFTTTFFTTTFFQQNNICHEPDETTLERWANNQFDKFVPFHEKTTVSFFDSTANIYCLWDDMSPLQRLHAFDCIHKKIHSSPKPKQILPWDMQFLFVALFKSNLLRPRVIDLLSYMTNLSLWHGTNVFMGGFLRTELLKHFEDGRTVDGYFQSQFRRLFVGSSPNEFFEDPCNKNQKEIFDKQILGFERVKITEPFKRSNYFVPKKVLKVEGDQVTLELFGGRPSVTVPRKMIVAPHLVEQLKLFPN